MSAGNLKNDRNKGNNHPYQFKTLQSLGAIIAATGAGATEATLQLVLAAIQNGSEFEARLVEDSLNVTWLEVRTWNTSGGTWNPPLYYPPGSNTPGTPTAPIVYINNSSVLALIETNTSTIATNTTDNATETTLALINAKLAALGQTNNAGSMPVTLSTEQEAMIDGIETLLGLVSTEATLLLTNGLLTTIDTVLDNILLDTTALVTLLTGVSRTPSVATATIDGFTTAGVKSVSLWFRGTGGTLGGQAVPNGTRVTYRADDNDDTVAALAYTVPTGGVGEILITYLT